MSKKSLDETLEEIAVEAQASKDMPWPPGTVPQRARHDNTVMSVRITKVQYAQLVALAEAEQIPTATLGRRLLVQGLNRLLAGQPAPGEEVNLGDELEAALRRTLAPRLLATA
jgi:hypothetical protein